jgi:hypothetical protein
MIAPASGIAPSLGQLPAVDGPRLPPIPEIGQDEHVYAHQARIAHEAGDREGRDAAKVGLYVTAALSSKMPWPEKLRHFEHALHKHCHITRPACHRIWDFYHTLGHLVREHCGQEALRLASREDDLYAARLAMGIPRQKIERDATIFFHSLIGDGLECPDYMLADDFLMIRMIRDQWC